MMRSVRDAIDTIAFSCGLLFSTLIAHQPLVDSSKLKRRSFYPFDVFR